MAVKLDMVAQSFNKVTIGVGLFSHLQYTEKRFSKKYV